MIRVCLADDQTLVRQGIRSLLESTGKVAVISEVADGDQVTERLASVPHDVLIMDVRMPRMNGIEALRALNQMGLSIPTIFLTTFDDDEALIAAMKAGASGFLLKSIEIAPLLNAIEDAVAGRSSFGYLPSERLVAALAKKHGASGLPLSTLSLTERERDVLQLMARGLSNKQIGKALSISDGTIKNHVSVVLSKLQVKDRINAVLTAISTGIIKP
jgi:DNA-binding NarL/FixJ family response regulator